MIRIIFCFFFLGCLAPSIALADGWAFDAPAARLSASSQTTLQQQAQPRALEIRNTFTGKAEESDALESFAQNLSYFGAILLTAHEVLASVQSWTDILEFRGQNGAQIELTKTPKGMGVMVLLSMPLD